MSAIQKCLLIVFHPLDCIDIIKREKENFKVLPVVLLYSLAILVNYTSIFFIHFPLSKKAPVDANFILEIAMIFVPLFSWSVACYAMTAIMSGESYFSEVLTVSAYALVPYIVLIPLLNLMSNIMDYSEYGIYSWLKKIVVIWVIILLFVGLQRLNSYSFSKTIIVALLSIVAVVVMWAVILLLLSLTAQFLAFFTNLFEEIRLKFFV